MELCPSCWIRNRFESSSNHDHQDAVDFGVLPESTAPRTRCLCGHHRMDKRITMKRLITSTLVAIAFVSGAAMSNRALAADIYISGTNFIRGYEIDGTQTGHKTR